MPVPVKTHVRSAVVTDPNRSERSTAPNMSRARSEEFASSPQSAGGVAISCGNAGGEPDVSVSLSTLRKQLVSIGGFSIVGSARQRPTMSAQLWAGA